VLADLAERQVRREEREQAQLGSRQGRGAPFVRFRQPVDLRPELLPPSDEDPQAGARFRAITSAYEVLETYCRSLQNFLGETPPYSFAREQVERTFTVKEQREACYP